MSLQNQPLWNLPTAASAPSQRDAAAAAASSTPDSAMQTALPEITREDLLTPRRIGGVFDLAFDIYRAHFRTLLTAVVVLLLPMQAVLYVLYNTWLKPLSNYADAHSDDAGPGLALIGGGLFTGEPHFGIPGVLALLVLAVTSAPVAIAVADIYRGKTPHWLDCYRRAFPLIPRVIGGWIIVALAFAAVLCFALVLCFIMLIAAALLLKGSGKMPDFVAILLFLLITVLPYGLGMTLVAFNFCFTTPLIVLENLPLTLIPARNWQLVGKRRALRTWAADCVFARRVFHRAGLDAGFGQQSARPVYGPVRHSPARPIRYRNHADDSAHRLFAAVPAGVPERAVLRFPHSARRVRHSPACRRNVSQCTKRGSPMRTRAIQRTRARQLALPCFAIPALPVRLACVLLIGVVGGAAVPVRVAHAQSSSSATGAANANAPQLKASLNRILESQEFQPESKEKSFLNQTIESLRGYWERIRKWFQNLFRMGGLAGGSSVVTGILVCLLLAGLFWVLLKIARERAPRIIGEAAPNAILAEEEAQADIIRDPDVWTQQAAEWAQKQDYRRAYRALFLALLLRLDAANALEYDQARTNGDYLRVLFAAKTRPLYDLLMPLAGGFDRFWYGQEPAQQSDYRSLQETVERLPALLATLAPSGSPALAAPASGAGKAQTA